MNAKISCRHIVGSLGALIVCLVWFELTPTDIWLQQQLFDFTEQQWVVSSADSLGRLLFYDGIKRILIAFGLGLMLCLIFIRRLPALCSYKSGMRIVLLARILVPACIGALKNTTNVACPRDLGQFGGDGVYAGIFGRYQKTDQSKAKYRCFPAGHASGGFALLSLFFLFQDPRNRRRALLAALATGWIMGTYKMLIGDHFLSHTVTTMLLAWLIVNVVALADSRIFRSDTDTPPQTRFGRENPETGQ